MREIVDQIKARMQEVIQHNICEINDEITRARATNELFWFLQTQLPGRQHIAEFVVVCDDTNNSVDLIKDNQFVIDVYVNFDGSEEFTHINARATRTGISYEEVIGGL